MIRPLVRIMILLVIWPCFTYDSIWFVPWFNPVRLMIRPFPSNISTPFHQWIGSWFDLVRLMVQPCSTNYSTSSTHESTLFDPWFEIWFDPWFELWFYLWFDPVLLMIRYDSTHDSTLFDSWFDLFRPIFRPRSTNESAHCFDVVRLMVQPC